MNSTEITPQKSASEFYIGYVPKAPAGLGILLRRTACGLVLGGLAVGSVLIFAQPPFAQSKFEYGVFHDYTGTIEEWPYPMLLASQGAFLLVGPGKHGLDGEVQGWRGKTVRLRGELIERGGQRMLEVDPASLVNTESPHTFSNARVSLGRTTLKGEIVDSKCYLGVMNPGEGKVHRECATRCISGGAPPAFIARDSNGDARVLLLVGSDGRKLNREVLPFVAEPLQISRELVRVGTNLVFQAEPASFQRLE